MSDHVWQLFPYPTLTDHGTTDGSLLPAHPACVSCPTRECLQDRSLWPGELRTCRYGITYSRIDESRLLTGVLASDLPQTTKHARNRSRKEPERRVRSQDLVRAIEQARTLGVGVVEDFESAKSELFARLESDPDLHQALAEDLRRDFADNLHQSHDFLQLVKLVRGHAEALLHDKHPDLTAHDAADKLPTEGAIYYSTELMLVKMDSMMFLNEINLAHGGERKFKIHSLLLKYVRIYNWQAKEKDLRLRVEGSSFSSCYYNDKAIGAVLQGLLDNLVKYAPAGSKATVMFEESEGHVHLTFTSLGPRIDPDEQVKIFLPKYRARAAKAIEMSGLGVGLATARQISEALDLKLTVDQSRDEDSRYTGRYRTSFSFQVARTE
jgi:signal transduction histidine kinase